MFRNCYPNTLDTTVTHSMRDGKPDTFVITGDIPAMWLRDSTAQVWPYLPLAKSDRKLQTMLAGVIHRQARVYPCWTPMQTHSMKGRPEAGGKRISRT